MGDLAAFLQKRLAGIPAWAWGLIVGGSIAGVVWIYRQRQGEPEIVPAPVAEPDGSIPADAGDIEGIPTVVEREIPIDTNPAWIRYVTDRLVADGEDPALVNNALTKVLAGLQVNAAEKAMWNMAVRRFGPPPEGAPPIVSEPSEPTDPGTGTEKRPTISLGIYPNSITYGGTIQLRGGTNPDLGNRVVGIQYFERGHWRQSTLSGRTDASGNYIISYRPNKRGTFTYRVYVEAGGGWWRGYSESRTLVVR